MMQVFPKIELKWKYLIINIRENGISQLTSDSIFLRIIEQLNFYLSNAVRTF